MLKKQLVIKWGKSEKGKIKVVLLERVAILHVEERIVTVFIIYQLINLAISTYMYTIYNNHTRSLIQHLGEYHWIWASGSQ